MNRRTNHFINDMKNSILKIEDFTKEMVLEDFIENELVKDAVYRNIEIIGEAARNLPDDLTSRYPNIPWRSIIGLRNIVVHAYFGIDDNNIWKIIKDDLIDLKEKLDSISDEG